MRLLNAASKAAAYLVASSCWKADTCRDYNFENRGRMAQFAISYCTNTWDLPAAVETYGYASAVTIGKWSSYNDCLRSFTEITEDCLGYSNGGSADTDTAHLVVAFGDCERL